MRMCFQIRNMKTNEDLFDTECTQPANIPPVHVDIKPEFEGKRFFRPEPLRSHKDQKIMDTNYKKLIDQGKAKLNPHQYIIWDRLLCLVLTKRARKLKEELEYVLMLDQSTKH